MGMAVRGRAKMFLPLSLLVLMSFSSVLVSMATGARARSTTSKLNGTDYFINDARFTSEDFCPAGSFVMGMRLKIEEYQGQWPKQDSGVNGIELFCTSPWKTDITTIRGKPGSYGNWKPGIFCPAFQFAVGFQLKLDRATPGIADNSGAVNVVLFCTADYGTGIGNDTGAGTVSVSVETERKGSGSGSGRGKSKWNQYIQFIGQGVPNGEHGADWMEPLFCDHNSALCSLQTKIATVWNIWAKDLLGLTTISASCCSLDD